MAGDHHPRCKQPNWLSQWAITPYSRPSKLRFMIGFFPNKEHKPEVYYDEQKVFLPFPPTNTEWASPVFDISTRFYSDHSVMFSTVGYTRVRIILVAETSLLTYKIVAKLQTSPDQTLMMFNKFQAWNHDSGPPMDMAFNTVLALCLPEGATHIKIRLFGSSEEAIYKVPYESLRFNIPDELTERATTKIPFDAPMYNYPNPTVPKKKGVKNLFNEARSKLKEHMTPYEWADYKKHVRRARRIANKPNKPLCKWEFESEASSNSSDSDWSEETDEGISHDRKGHKDKSKQPKRGKSQGTSRDKPPKVKKLSPIDREEMAEYLEATLPMVLQKVNERLIAKAERARLQQKEMVVRPDNHILSILNYFFFPLSLAVSISKFILLFPNPSKQT